MIDMLCFLPLKQRKSFVLLNDENVSFVLHLTTTRKTNGFSDTTLLEKKWNLVGKWQDIVW